MTGGIAEGKSTVLGYLREMGYRVASGDDIARRVFESEPVQAALAVLLGQEPPVEPSHLRDAISESHATRRAANRLLHPAILKALDAEPADFVEVPLLLETCIQGRFGRVWVVTCGEQEQLRRLIARLGDEERARRLVDIQLSASVKTAFADEIVRTNQSESAVRANVAAAVAREFNG